MSLRSRVYWAAQIAVSVGGIDELERNLDGVVLRPGRTREDDAGMQLLRDVTRRPAAIIPRGRPAEHFQPGHLPEPADEILRQSVGEIRLRSIGAREIQWNDGDHRRRRPAQHSSPLRSNRLALEPRDRSRRRK